MSDQAEHIRTLLEDILQRQQDLEVVERSLQQQEQELQRSRAEIEAKKAELARNIGLAPEAEKKPVRAPVSGKRFRDGVRRVLAEQPGLGPSDIWVQMQNLGYESSSKNPRKMVSIALTDMKNAGYVESRDGGWYLVGEPVVM